MTPRPAIAVIPFSGDFAQGALFVSGRPPDRDGSLLPYAALKARLEEDGWKVDTADRLEPGEPVAWLHLDSANPPPPTSIPERTVLMMFEPEVVSPYWYRRVERERLPFRRIYTYRRDLVARGEPFRYLHCPQVLGAPPEVERDEFMVMINARKYPARGAEHNQLYSSRERVAAWFARRGLISIYGPGWDRASWRHPVAAMRTGQLRRAARGAVTSKFDVLGRARFVLCFENMVSPGYHTEKIFDAIAGGSVPIYLGDPAISDIVPRDVFIDYREAGNPAGLYRVLIACGASEQQRMRRAGRNFLDSSAFDPYRITEFVDRLAQDFEEMR